MRGVGLRNLGLGLILGASLGFVLANIIYRARGADRANNNSHLQLQMPLSAAENSAVKSNAVQSNAPQSNLAESVNQKENVENDLSVDELHQALAKAESDQGNLQLQRDLGIALYKYAGLEQKTELLPDAVRLLLRAEQKAFPKDEELHETLGNALFVIGQQENDQKKLLAARQAYQKALGIEPQNADLMIKIGLTYFFEQPSNPSAAIVQYKQALKLQPLNEKALENLTISLLAVHQTAEASLILKKLREASPNNKAINDLQTQIIQAQLKVN